MLKRYAVDPMCRNRDPARLHSSLYPVSRDSYLNYHQYGRRLLQQLDPILIRPQCTHIEKSMEPFLFPHTHTDKCNKLYHVNISHGIDVPRIKVVLRKLKASNKFEIFDMVIVITIDYQNIISPLLIN